jgi:hypothetical protein
MTGGKEEMDDQTEAVLANLYAQLEDSTISPERFDEIVRRIERLKALA